MVSFDNMDAKLKLEIFTISIWQLIAIIVLVSSCIILFMKANRTASLKAFFYVQFTIVLWLIGKILKTVSPNADMRWSFIVLYYFAICLLEAAFLEFGYAYYKGRAFRWKVKIFIYILPLIQFVVIATNPYHLLFYKSFNFYRDKFGMLFYVHTIIVYLYIIIGIVLCGIKLKEQFRNKSKGYRILMVLAILGPVVLNILYITRILQKIFYFINFKIIFDVTPIVFTWSLLLFVYATFKYEFFDISPIMKHEIVHKLDTPICIIDTSGDVLFANQRINDHFHFNSEPQLINNFIMHNRRWLTTDGYRSYINDTFKFGDKYYMYYSKKIQNIGGTKFIIVFNEVTSYIMTRKQLSEKNTELRDANNSLNKQIDILKNTSRIGARNFVARELHDIIGHSLVVTMKLLEVAKLSYKDNKTFAIQSLKNAKSSTINGLNEMKSVNQDKKDNNIYSGRLLKKDIETMLRSVKESGVEAMFFIKGEHQKINEKIYAIVKRVCTELVTNTLKHANAKRLLISCNLLGNSLHLSFMDDGRGAIKLSKGNGLNGIEARLMLIGGTVSFTTYQNEGFCAHINIPL